MRAITGTASGKQDWSAGSEADAAAFVDALTLFGIGYSWGGYESLAISCDPQLSRRSFRPDHGGPLMRLHVGLEAPDDLIADLQSSLDELLRVEAARGAEIPAAEGAPGPSTDGAPVRSEDEPSGARRDQRQEVQA